MITFPDFQKLNIKIGTIVQAEPLPDSQKLIKLQVDIGDQTRQILAGIKEYYQPEELINTQIVLLTNLEPKTMMGQESQGMLLAADNDGQPVLLTPQRPVPSGTKVK